MKLEHLNNIVQGLVHPEVEIIYSRYTGINEPEPYYFIWFKNRAYHFDKEDMVNIDKMIQHCWNATKPKWRNFSSICGHSIGDIVYVDKTIPITIESILQSAEGTKVLATNLEFYDTNSLWIKK